MRLNLCFFVLLASTSLLTACRSEMTARVYISDVVERPTTSAPLSAELTLRGYGPGLKDKCNQTWEAVEPIFARVLSDLALRGCEDGFEDSIEFVAKIPLIRLKGDSLDSIIGIAVGLLNGKLETWVVLDSSKFNWVRTQLKNVNYLADIDPSKMTVNVEFTNASRQPVKLVTSGVYQNGKPFSYTKETELGGRQRAMIKLGDVKRDTLLLDGSVPLVTFLPNERN